MKASPHAHPRTRNWLTIQEASELIGVSTATLRRWTEAGEVEAFVTPGGHRRFARASMLGLLPRPGHARHRTLSELGETPDRVVRQYRRDLASVRSQSAWLTGMDDSAREPFRDPGRRILAGMLGYLDAPSPAHGEVAIAQALEAASDYGRLAHDRDLGLSETTEVFLRFRAPFLDELGKIARRRQLETSQAVDLLLAATRVFDRLLSALIDGHSHGTEAAAPA